MYRVRFAGGVGGVEPPCFFFDPPASDVFSTPPGVGLDPSASAYIEILFFLHVKLMGHSNSGVVEITRSAGIPLSFS